MSELQTQIQNLFGKNPVLTDLQKNVDVVNDLAKKGLEDLNNILIETKVGSDKNANKYTTKISLGNDVVSTMPKEAPKVGDVYWARHNELTNKILDQRHELLVKAIETAGTTVKGVINPINFSNIDLENIISLLKKQ